MTWRVGYFIKANEGVYSVIRSALPEGCELVTLSNGSSPAALVKDINFLIAGKAPRSVIDAGPALKLIMCPGVGYDGIDLEAAAQRAIPVAPTVCGNTTEVAEHTLLLMLAVSRRLVELDNSTRAGKWMMWDRRLSCFNLAGKTLGLIGYGRIGREVARRASAFDMPVQYFDPAAEQSTALEDLISTSDFVSLHLPLTSETRGLMNAARIGAMRPGSVLINTSRGEVVDEPALIDALRRGHLAGAGLDVFETEPPPADNALFAMPNVVVTPHVASGTVDGLRVKAERYAENIRRVLAGKPPIDQLS